MKRIIILTIVLAALPGCPYWLLGKAREQHNHCATKVQCLGVWDPDAMCCFECGGRCN